MRPLKRTLAVGSWNSRRMSVTLVSLALVCVAGLAAHPVLTRAFSERASPRPPRLEPRDPEEPASGVAASPSTNVQGEVLTLTSHGFEPNKLVRPAGLFLLIVQNRSTVELIELTVDRTAGPRLRDIPVSKGHYDWNDFFNLTPGEYMLTEAGHPLWTCQITITP
jgi:hypothetical protein